MRRFFRIILVSGISLLLSKSYSIAQTSSVKDIRESRELSRLSDSTYLKKIKYEKLDSLISYHVISSGKFLRDENLRYIFTPLGEYNFLNHSFELFADSKGIQLKSDSIQVLLFSSKFSNLSGFKAIFKINTEIAYKWRPNILMKISVFPKKADPENIRLLTDKLEKEGFGISLSLDTMKLSAFDSLENKTIGRIYIKVNVKPSYWNIKRLGLLAKELKIWPEIEDAVYVELFTGYSKGDTFYYLSSN
jgi:hypothetical protein